MIKNLIFLKKNLEKCCKIQEKAVYLYQQNKTILITIKFYKIMTTIAFQKKNNRVNYLGELTFNDLVSRYSDRLFEREGKLYDEVGEVVSEQTEGTTGILDFDGDYDMVWAFDANDLEYEFGYVGAEGWAKEMLKEYCSDELKEVLSQWIEEEDDED